MIQDVRLSAAHEKQIEGYTCGPACINIVLSHWGKSRPQLDVWDDVKANTTPSLRPGDARSDAGSFSNQDCDLCSNRTVLDPDGMVYGDYSCWYTTPEAMAATINASSPAPVQVDYIIDGEDTIRRLADSISNGDVPAVFTTLPSLHWIVAYGYRFDDTVPVFGSEFVKWGTRYITGIYVYNPSDGAPAQSTVQMVTPPGLVGLDSLLMKIECGPRVGEYPVVAAAIATPAAVSLYPKSVVSPRSGLINWVRVWFDPNRFRKYWVRRKPGPPPKN